MPQQVVYNVRYTNAPQSYDYGYCESRNTDMRDRNGNVIRQVFIPVERVAYQTGRYHSGMYFVASDKLEAESYL